MAELTTAFYWSFLFGFTQVKESKIQSERRKEKRKSVKVIYIVKKNVTVMLNLLLTGQRTKEPPSLGQLSTYAVRHTVLLASLEAKL